MSHLPQKGNKMPNKNTRRDPRVYVIKHPANIMNNTPTTGYCLLKLCIVLPSMDTYANVPKSAIIASIPTSILTGWINLRAENSYK